MNDTINAAFLSADGPLGGSRFYRKNISQDSLKIERKEKTMIVSQVKDSFNVFDQKGCIYLGTALEATK